MIACTTEDILSLSDRAEEAIGKALNITQTLIQSCLNEIRTNFLNTLFVLSDSVVSSQK